MEAYQITQRRLLKDLDETMEVYKLAESLYPYSNLQDQRTFNDNADRQNLSRIHDKKEMPLIKGGALWGVLGVYLLNFNQMSRFYDLSPILRTPLRSSIIFFGTISLMIQGRIGYYKKISDSYGNPANSVAL